AAVEPDAPPELGLTRGTVLGERGHHREVVAAVALLPRRIAHRPRRPRRALARRPARQLLQTARRGHTSQPRRWWHQLLSLGYPTLETPMTDRQDITDLISPLARCLAEKA